MGAPKIGLRILGVAIWLAFACGLADGADVAEQAAAARLPEPALFGDAWVFLAMVAVLLAALFVWLRRRSPP